VRSKLLDKVEFHRVTKGSWRSEFGDGANGAFLIMGPNGRWLRIIASDGTNPVAEGWEHVSVSREDMKFCPSWVEMCFVKDLFWDEEETVIQFHPPKSEYVNHHPTTLHLWRDRAWDLTPFATPSPILVGPK
jgi:hypothetical protein